MTLKLKLIASIVSAGLCLALIAFVNYLQIVDWFGKNGPANLGSIEVSYVSMGRFLIDFGSSIGSGSTWLPFWYFGFPFHLFYTPLLPFLEALIHRLLGIPLWETYRLLTGTAYILAPISVFFLGWQLSGRFVGGIIAGAIYSVAPSIMYFVAGEIATDRFSPSADGFLDPRRFTILVRWGEGPHIFSLIFVPLVGVFFARLIQQYKFRWVLLSSLFLGLSALTNAIGLFSSVILIGVMTFVKFAQDPKTRFFTFKSTLIVGALTLGLISFWYNISFISSFFKEGGGTRGLLISLFPWGWIGILVGVFAIYLLFSKVIRDFGIASSLLLFFIFFGVVAYYYLSAPPEESYRRIELIPQALRYNVEVDLSLSLLIGVLFAWLVGFLGKRLYILEIVGNLVGVLGALGLLLYIQPFIPVASKAAGEVVNIKNTGEYEIASWLNSHVDQKKGERVFVPGNYGFYLNYFTNIWQHRGGLFQAATHSWVEHMHYQLANGKNADIARAWFVIANIKYAVIPTIASRELYKEIKNQERFSDYKIANNQSGDIIYEVPLKKPSLAKPISLSKMKSLIVPKKADDKKALLVYADWVENSSAKQTSFNVIDNDNYQIKGEVGQGEGILVQMTADEGWAALRPASQRGEQAQGKLESVKTGKDPLGFLVLYPQAGEVDITLKHSRTWVIWLGYLVTIGTIGFLVWYGVSGAKKYPVFSKSVSSIQ